jgi:hypothetical protein
MDICFNYYKIQHPELEEDDLLEKMLEKRDEDMELFKFDGLCIEIRNGVICNVTFRKAK